MGDDSTTKTATADSFGASADGYLRSETHRAGADLDLLASWCADASVALDVATGAGHTAGALRDAGVPTVVATDAAPEMVATCVDAFPGVDGVVADAERLPFASGAFDAVTCRIAAHHFPAPERFVREVARVLRPGGVFAFEDNVAPESDAVDAFLNRLERLRDPTHVRSYRASTWTRWLDDAGFDVAERERLVKRIDFEPWVERIDALDAEDGERVRRLLLDAPDRVADALDVRYADGGVGSFGSPKAAIRAVRR